jgi:hypothetical protein
MIQYTDAHIYSLFKVFFLIRIYKINNLIREIQYIIFLSFFIVPSYLIY